MASCDFDIKILDFKFNFFNEWQTHVHVYQLVMDGNWYTCSTCTIVGELGFDTDTSQAGEGKCDHFVSAKQRNASMTNGTSHNNEQSTCTCISMMIIPYVKIILKLRYINFMITHDK